MNILSPPFIVQERIHSNKLFVPIGGMFMHHSWNTADVFRDFSGKKVRTNAVLVITDFRVSLYCYSSYMDIHCYLCSHALKSIVAVNGNSEEDSSSESLCPSSHHVPEQVLSCGDTIENGGTFFYG